MRMIIKHIRQILMTALLLMPIMADAQPLRAIHTHISTKDGLCSNAISTLRNAGILEGYEDRSFRPDNSVTRAEFTAIIGRFFDLTAASEAAYTDISQHWAEELIRSRGGNAAGSVSKIRASAAAQPIESRIRFFQNRRLYS